VQPTARVAGVAGEKQNAIRPTRGEIVGIVDAVRTEEAIPFRDLISLATSAKKIKSVPKSKFVD
jgi:hypothetical protein